MIFDFLSGKRPAGAISDVILQKPADIAEFLERLKTDNVMLSVTFLNQVKGDIYKTNVLRVDRSARYFWVDELSPVVAAEYVLQAKRLMLDFKYKFVNVRSTLIVESITNEGKGSVYKIPFPQEIFQVRPRGQRRESHRVEVEAMGLQVTVTVLGSRVVNGLLCDVSMTGFSFQPTERLEILANAPIRGRFQLPGLPVAFKGIIKVVKKDPDVLGKVRLGVNFSEIDKETLKGINQFMLEKQREELKKRAALFKD